MLLGPLTWETHNRRVSIFINGGGGGGEGGGGGGGGGVLENLLKINKPRKIFTIFLVMKLFEGTFNALKLKLDTYS